MKNGLKAIGKAATYFAVYFFAQVVVSVVFSVGLSVKMAIDAMRAGEEIDSAIMAEQLTVEIMNQAMLMTFVAGILTLLIYWIIFLIRKKEFTREVCIFPISVEGILPIAVMAACFNVITTVVISFFPWPQSWIESYATNSSAIDNSLIAWITAVLMAPILEEVVFRGLLYTRLKKGLPVFIAAIITSLVFGIMHGTIIWFIYTFIFSLVLIWVFERFKSLTASILLHMSYNISGMALALIPEDAGVLVLVLFTVSILGAGFAYKKVVEVTAAPSEIKEFF